MKVCRVCGVEKPLDEFYRNFAMKDGYVSQCRTCQCAAQTQRRTKGERVPRPVPRRQGRWRHAPWGGDQASLAALRALLAPQPPVASTPVRQVFLSIPVPPKGSVALSLLRPPFKVGGVA